MDAWRNFNRGDWCEKIGVSDFIRLNYTPYDGDAAFLAGPTERTKRLWEHVQMLMKIEQERGGVFDVDHPRLLDFKLRAGYIIKGTDIILGLQTEKPLVRASTPLPASATPSRPAAHTAMR